MTDSNIKDAIDELDDLFAGDNGGSSDDDEVPVIPVTDAPHFTIPKGKYKGLTLPRMIGVKPSYYERVVALRDEIVQDPDFQRQAGSLAQTYAALRREANARAAELSEIKLRLAAVTLLMTNQFEAEGESGVRLTNGDAIRVQPEPHLVVMDKDTFRQWCIKQGFEQSMVLPWGMANRIVKDMLGHGEPEPPGTTVFVRDKVVFTAGEK